MQEEECPNCSWCYYCKVACVSLYNNCCCCCKKLHAASKHDSFPHIFYGQLGQQEKQQQQAGGRWSLGREKSPVSMGYGYPQQRQELTLPAELVKGLEEMVVRHQPHGARRTSEPRESVQVDEDFSWTDHMQPLPSSSESSETIDSSQSVERYSIHTADQSLPSRRNSAKDPESSQGAERYNLYTTDQPLPGSRKSSDALGSRRSSDIRDFFQESVDRYSLYGGSMSPESDIEMTGHGHEPAEKRPSLLTIQRSPEQTLQRGEHVLRFPKSSRRKKMDISAIRKMDSSLMRKLGELQPERTPDFPGVHFSLSFDEQKSMLIVHLSHATNLPTQRPMAATNPFVQLYLLPSKMEVFQSKSVEGTLSPSFDQFFRFGKMPMEKLRKSALVMRFHININHFIGGMMYGLDEADLMGSRTVQDIIEFDEEEGLKDSCPGDILLSICYQSRAEVLEVLVLEVNNLKKKDILRLPNPYIKVNLMYHNQRISKWKTSTKKNTCNAIFSELCEIDISSMNLEEIELDVMVMNYDRLGHNNEIGGISLGNNSSHNSGQSHWNRVMIDTNTSISRWHPLVCGTDNAGTRPTTPSPKQKKSIAPVQGCFKMIPSQM